MTYTCHLFYTIEMILDKNQVLVIFLTHVQSDSKQWLQFTKPAVCLAQKLLTDRHCSGGSRHLINVTRASRWEAQWLSLRS